MSDWREDDDMPPLRETEMLIILGRMGICEATTDGTIRIETGGTVIELSADSLDAWAALIIQIGDALTYWQAIDDRVRRQVTFDDIAGAARLVDGMRG